MKRTVSAGEARQRLGEMLEGVFYRGDEVVIERAGKPMAVVIPARIYEQIEAQREQVWHMIQEAQERNKDLSEEESMQYAVEAVREVRREMAEEVGKAKRKQAS